MNDTKDGFEIMAFKMLLSVLSLVIMIPMVDTLTDVSFYVSVCVYVLGKFVDLVAKINQRNFKLFFVIYILGLTISIIAAAMCFCGFASTNNTNEITNTLLYNRVLLGLVTAICFVDVSDFVFCICRLSYTRRKLHHFDRLA